jgi:hypothetical protein
VSTIGQRRELAAYLSIAAGMFATYALAGLVLHEARPFKFFFGFNQLKRPGVTGTLVLALAAAASILLFHRRRESVLGLAARARSALYRWKLLPIAVAALSAFVFFLLRSNFLNQDALDLIGKFERDVPLEGSHVTHDEMWELYLHSRFWFHTNRWFGWSVALSYQVLSALAGGLFVLLLLRYARCILPARPIALTLLVASGGFLQLFFGDVENYTLTAVVILAYLHASARYLQGRGSIVAPAGLLALALTFHLLAGWLIPSLTYLGLLELRRGRVRHAGLAAAVFLAILGLTLAFFHGNGLPIGDLFRESHAFGEGGDILSKLARPSARYYLGLINLLFLLVPSFPLLLPLLTFRRIPRNPLNVHLALCSAFLLVYLFTWKATLGVYSDWNLFANLGVPLSILIWHNLLSAEDLPHRGEIALALFWIFGMHSCSWIVANHLGLR